MAAPKQTSYKDLINTILFIVIITAVGITTLLTPKENFSAYEKRTLAAFPTLSKETFFSGNFFKGIDSYYADHFIFRISITEIDNRIKSYLGVKDDGVMLYAESATPQKNTAFANKASPTNLEPASGEESTRDKTPASTNEDASQETSSIPDKASTSASADQNDFQTIKSIIVYQKRAVQIFGGSEKMIKSYAELANQYKEELGPEVSVYVMAIPSGSDFFLPESIKKNVNREKNNISLLNKYLSPSVISVAAYDNIAKHTNEYIQFKTDHHWTGLGAYYAYQAFCKAANLNPLALGDFTKKEIPHFLGTLYYRTLSEDLKENPDQVDYYMTPNETDAYYYLKDSTKPIQGKTYVEFAKGSNAYGVFLGGDYPLMKIVTDVKNGKKIVVIKDSYGNAFAPYLTSHYEEVYIIDYRHYKGDLKSLMSKNKINEILLAHNTFMLNSSYTIAREREMLHGVKSAKKENTIDIKEK
jgi:hypothetical protein